jgi:hypothetical protein
MPPLKFVANPLGFDCQLAGPHLLVQVDIKVSGIVTFSLVSAARHGRIEWINFFMTCCIFTWTDLALSRLFINNCELQV